MGERVGRFGYGKGWGVGVQCLQRWFWGRCDVGALMLERSIDAVVGAVTMIIGIEDKDEGEVDN